MVPGGGSDDSPLSFLWVEMGQEVNASSAFEGSQWKVFVVLQVNLGLQHLAQAGGEV